MYKIIDGIYQGGIPYEGLPADVQAVVTLNDRSANLPPTLRAHLKMYIPDAEFPGIRWLETVVDAIHAFRKADMPVYIHCQAGISRSTMVTAAYLMKYHGLKRQQAIEKIGKVNPDTDPNPRFVMGLKEWEQKLLSS